MAETVGTRGAAVRAEPRGRVVEGLRTYRLIAAMWIRSTMAYRTSFALTTFGNFAMTALDFVAILLMFSRVDALGGWSLGEVALLYGLSGVSFGLADLAIGSMDRLGRRVRAVDGLSFTVARGEMVGYIGPNGAGKSTTIKMLTGILTPSGGRLRVAGIDPSRERTRLAHRIGVVFGQRTTLWWDLPLIDSYRLMHRMYRIPDARYRENLDRCVELLRLGELLDVPVRQLSLGQRMRGDIAAALLHDPDVLYLDEPTIGLDVVSKAKVRGFLRDLNAERGTTVLLTTHDLQDIEQLCSRVMVIDHGRLMYDGPLAGLHEAGESERTLVVDLERELPPIEAPAPARVVRVEGPRQWLAFPASASAAGLVAAVAARYPLVDLSVREPDIESVIAKMYAERSSA
ncbi:ATP-binding cassette domain-containing protein [Streptomyces sp. CRB46]|uniref:ATP-binding cassette domain-containing protein n=1 Tax=Streptomyces sp. CRB46 TaxID=2682613 RepID=UPI0018F51F90|nr:ATP-binding cassette domain-containing protein [Streptomyces sp. CRB46]